MAEVIWVEVLSRNRDVAARYRLTGAAINIGRGYENDVIVDDPYVADQHLRLCRDEAGHVVAENLGGGLFLGRGTHSHARLVVDGNQSIRIGHTYLRVREAHHPVPPAKSYRASQRHWPAILAAGLGIAVIAIAETAMWLTETTEPTASRYLLPVLIIALLGALWVGLWALVSRLVAGTARFTGNLTIALAGLLVSMVYGELSDFVAFSLSWRAIASYEDVGIWLILAGVCFLHLRQVGPSHLRLKGAAIAVLCFLAIGLQLLWQHETADDRGDQIAGLHFLPPALHLSPVHDEKAFFTELTQLKTRLDNEREKALEHDTAD
jgi:hypothetical protein